ncbi:hypothetical protein [Myxosarcina sp. GI1]|uniref:hypothetical protein n=1 Tax=Myxosarcina sp. GI1 TaxID=1541065 RepID=UPI000563BB52|nr:hypothetical protein [Myxosarcina sp. GI1]
MIQAIEKSIIEIEAKIERTQEAINTQKQMLRDLQSEDNALNHEMLSISDPDHVDECFDRCETRQKEIANETKKLELRIKSYKAALKNSEKELEQAIEARRLAVHAEYDDKIAKQTPIVNEAVSKAQKEIQKLEALTEDGNRKAGITNGSSTERNASRFGDSRILAKVTLPFVRYSKERKQVYLTLGSGNWDYTLNQMEKNNSFDNWIF